MSWFLSLIKMGLMLVLTHEEVVRRQHVPGSGPGVSDVFLPDYGSLFESCS